MTAPAVSAERRTWDSTSLDFDPKIDVPAWVAAISNEAYEDVRPFQEWFEKWVPEVTVHVVTPCGGPYLTALARWQKEATPAKHPFSFEIKGMRLIPDPPPVHTGTPWLLLETPEGWVSGVLGFGDLSFWDERTSTTAGARRTTIHRLFDTEMASQAPVIRPDLTGLAEALFTKAMTPAYKDTMPRPTLANVEALWQVVHLLSQDDRDAVLTLAGLACPALAQVLALRDVVESNLPYAVEALTILDEAFMPSFLILDKLEPPTAKRCIEALLSAPRSRWFDTADELVSLAKNLQHRDITNRKMNFPKPGNMWK